MPNSKSIKNFKAIQNLTRLCTCQPKTKMGFTNIAESGSCPLDAEIYYLLAWESTNPCMEKQLYAEKISQ